MLMLAAAPVCVAPVIVHVVAICALGCGVAIGTVVTALILPQIGVHRNRKADPYAAPFGEQPVNHMRAFNGGEQ